MVLSTCGYSANFMLGTARFTKKFSRCLIPGGSRSSLQACPLRSAACRAFQSSCTSWIGSIQFTSLWPFMILNIWIASPLSLSLLAESDLRSSFSRYLAVVLFLLRVFGLYDLDVFLIVWAPHRWCILNVRCHAGRVECTEIYFILGGDKNINNFIFP